MFRKIGMLAIPAAAFALIVCATDNSASQAFAKGIGRGGHGPVVRNGHRDFHRGHYGRYFGWGYPYSYGYGYPACGYGVACEQPAPIVTASVIPAVTTCEPVYGGGYWGWGYGRYRFNHHFRGGRGHMSHGGHGRR